MDKVRAFMKVAWAQRFWILSVVGVLAAVICWNMASGELQRQFAANKTQIDGKFGEMTAITGKQFHGNEGVNSKEREEAKKIAKSVQDLWQSLFDAQREEVLKWPDVLGNDFVDYIKNAKFDSPIKQLFRDRYQNYAKERFAGLVEIVHARKMAAEGAGFGAGFGREGGPGGAQPGAVVEYDAQGIPIEENYILQWADQGNLRQQLEFTAVPTARQMWVTQEDLWVYETLLRAIANTNKERGATRPDNAAISVIQSLQVGVPAALAMAQESTILMPSDAMAAGGDMAAAMEGGGAMMSREGMEGGMGGAESLDAMLLANRYIDAEGKPIPDASTGAGVEFRRLPIRMILSMDERYLPKVLVECANAPLPVEVQRLRINAEKSGTDKDNQAFDLGAAASAGGMGGMGRGMEGGMGRGSMGMPMGRGMEGGMGGATLTPVDIPNMVTVDIQGLVYIYNAPDATILTVPGDDAAATGSETLAAGDAAVVR